MQRHPVTVVGAGPAGCTVALALSRRGIPVLLLDQSTFPRDKVCGDALSGKVVLTLNRIDPALAANLRRQDFTMESHGVEFFAPNGKSLKLPFRKEAGTELAPGFITRRMDFDNWLFRQAASANGVTVHTGVRIENFRREEGMWIIGDSTGANEFRTDLLIAADGAQSRFARSVGGIQVEDEHYCAGLRKYYRGVKDLDPKGYIELHFLPDFLPGYFWIFPLKNGAANVGVGLRSDVVSRKRINLKEKMDRIIREHPVLSRRFADAVPEGPVRGYGLPLGSKRRPISGDGYILLGDAGSLIDPFTGEGIGNAMISGLKAAEVVASCEGDYSAERMKAYDEAVYDRLWPELNLSKRMQELVRFPWLFNLVVNKASRSAELRDTIACMFEDIDLRGRLKDPRFYWRVLMA